MTGGNRNDVTQLVPLVERVPAVRGKVGRPRRRPDRVTADRGYDHDKYRRELRARRIKPEIARRQTEHGSGLGRVRWVVERTFAWLHNYKRLLVRHSETSFKSVGHNTKATPAGRRRTRSRRDRLRTATRAASSRP